MSDSQFNADVGQYRQAAAMNTAPPQVVSDPLVAGATPVEQLLRLLGLAANLGDQQDNAISTEQHAERDARTREAADNFAAQDEEAAAELNSLYGETYPAGEVTSGLPDQSAAMTQQLPQMASGIAGALAGAVGGALQPLAQLPQQAAQGVGQALQTGMGLFQQTAGGDDALLESAPLAEAPLTGEIDSDWAGPGGLGAYGGLDGDIGTGGFGAGGAAVPDPLGGTAPTAHLGPPPVPSAGTAPSSAPISPLPPVTAGPAPPHGTAGMTGLPLVPPGAMPGTPGSDRDGKADTKRVSVPPVRNGAPVQGRLTVPPAAPPVVKQVDGKPLVTRRIVAPADTGTDVPRPDS